MFLSHHPTYQFKNVFVADKDVIGGGNSGMIIVEVGFDTKINHCCENVSAAGRMIEEATSWASSREIQNEKLIDKQAIQFYLADSVTELWASNYGL